MAKKYQDSPFGLADYPHLNKPDGKFNPENPLWKTGLILEGAEAQKFKEMVDAEAETAFEEYMTNGEGSKLTAGERKKWGVYKPYAIVEDQDGNETDQINFDFKQNSVIRTADGKKEIKIARYDASGKKELPEHMIIRGGSEIRVRFGFRTIVMKSQKLVGVRHDFSMVQVRKFATSAGAGGFGAVEGDTYEDEPAEGQTQGFSGPAPDSADY